MQFSLHSKSTMQRKLHSETIASAVIIAKYYQDVTVSILNLATGNMLHETNTFKIVQDLCVLRASYDNPSN